MKYTTLGSTGLQVSRLCLGCMSYGTPEWRPWVLPEDEAGQQEALLAFMDSDPLAAVEVWSHGGRRRLAALAWLDATGLWEPPTPVDDDGDGR